MACKLWCQANRFGAGLVKDQMGWEKGFWARWECGVQNRGLEQEGGERMSDELVGNEIRRNPSPMNI